MNIIKKTCVIGMLAVFSLTGCVPKLTDREYKNSLPEQYENAKPIDNNMASGSWRDYFHDPLLAGLIDTALNNNQELNIVRQEVDVMRNEVRARKGEYLPYVNLEGGGGVEKVSRYTRDGSVEANNEILPGKAFPEPLGDMYLGTYASWELDVWNKLRSAKAAAYQRYLGSLEGLNFLKTRLIAEIAVNYYELLALDQQLSIVNNNIQIQTDALEVVKLQKTAARVTELAVKRFEAQLAKTGSLQYEIQQKIIETENEINLLIGRYPQRIARSSSQFTDEDISTMGTGLPADLLANRPDVRKAELDMTAAKLDVKSAKASFYPSIGLKAGIGFQAFEPTYFFKTPESLLYSLMGDLSAPIINRNAIVAEYKGLNARQIQSVIEYEQTILKAYLEIANQLSNIKNLQNSYDLVTQQVNALEQSVDISNNLFRSARADYMEVLLTQREAFESRFELVEVRLLQLRAKVDLYRALGGGWK